MGILFYEVKVRTPWNAEGAKGPVSEHVGHVISILSTSLISLSYTRVIYSCVLIIYNILCISDTVF